MAKMRLNCPSPPMNLLPNAQKYELCMRERVFGHRGLAIATFQDRFLAVSFEVSGGENVPGIPAHAQPARFRIC